MLEIKRIYKAEYIDRCILWRQLMPIVGFLWAVTSGPYHLVLEKKPSLIFTSGTFREQKLNLVQTPLPPWANSQATINRSFKTLFFTHWHKGTACWCSILCSRSPIRKHPLADLLPAGGTSRTDALLVASLISNIQSPTGLLCSYTKDRTTATIKSSPKVLDPL